MVDFHYSDDWADPSKQRKPSVWDDCTTLDEMADKLYKYTKKVLTALKVNGVDVTWVQIGNETQNGMCETNSDGSATSVSGWMGPDYVKLHNAGAKAAKEIFPECLTVVHFQNGQQLAKNINSLNKLKSGGAEYDVFGVSLYPDFSDENWYADYVDACIETLKTVKTNYGKDVMVCEVGCRDITSENARVALNDVVVRCRDEVKATGVFFWEPECYNAWQGYAMGGFLDNGRPSPALINAFDKNNKTVLHK
jgi:arabinogalactan endo-1,4-beta-galactosidase